MAWSKGLESEDRCPLCNRKIDDMICLFCNTKLRGIGFLPATDPANRRVYQLQRLKSKLAARK